MVWLDELNTALDLYNEGNYEECAAHINVVLQDTTPGYPRTRYYALLASCAEDWHEAERLRFNAETCYSHWCVFNRPGSYPDVDNIRTKLRTFDYQLTWTETDAEERNAERNAELIEAMTEQDADIADGEEERHADDAEAETKQLTHLEEG
ncbi:hypothetical protein D6D01_06263 [Aureobasidium pullulans]|uniref:TPR-like protein n=1 Tax=Aureobasidium pullulans TaxID=5580 RepID=A0A4S9L0R3_AURPU|nr:hypothetical protein D6D01_06263 [Aureobasidium pullulans]